MATIRSAYSFVGWKDEAMKNAAVALVIAITLLSSPPAETRDRVRAGMVVSSTTAGLIACAQGYSPEYGRALYLGTAPAIFGYGYRATYYGNGFSYQPAYYPRHAYYVGPRFRRCCRW
jgi:hypothetical protein